MQFQLTRDRIINTLLIGTMALAIGSFHIQPAAAQLDRSTFREVAQELNLSQSQMREVAGIMRGFNSELQEILTPEQLERMQLAQEQQSQTHDTQEIKEALNLTDTQVAQLAAAREDMVVDLEGVLEPYQVEGIMEMTAVSQL